ncbi:hypothetical protein E3N88_02856 [Mikania micrantha]|uniref:Uncharacterized protein n=1 Tax=Mikania micrantha TaxID=192012 RepID=A0A5N6Q7P0_9ASTR|nr:hypothetical protein E3N88_02856 [Mikania micrantha]
MNYLIAPLRLSLVGEPQNPRGRRRLPAGTLGPHVEDTSRSPEKKTESGSPEKKTRILPELLASDGETDTTDGFLATRGERWCRDWWMAPPWFAGNEPARWWWCFSLLISLSPPSASLSSSKL